MNLLIEVTQADIDEGTPLTATDCAIARALRRHGQGEPTVTKWSVELEADGGCWAAVPPPIAAAFVDAYDEGSPVAPFSFPLMFDWQEAVA